MDLSRTIIIEKEGVFEEVNLYSINDLLEKISDISIDVDDFIKKTEYRFFDETSLSIKDNYTLEDWFFYNNF